MRRGDVPGGKPYRRYWVRARGPEGQNESAAAQDSGWAASGQRVGGLWWRESGVCQVPRYHIMYLFLGCTGIGSYLGT